MVLYVQAGNDARLVDKINQVEILTTLCTLKL